MNNYPGRIQPINPSGLQFNQDSPIDYRVDFPVTTPLPRLTYLIVNGNVLCYGPGDVARPDLYVSTISLQHMQNLRGRRPGDPGPIKLISSSPDADVFAIDVDSDRTDTWNDGFQRPQQRPQTQRPAPPPTDEYYLLELPLHTTTTRRPQQQPQPQRPARPPPQPQDEYYLLELPLPTTTTRRPQQQPQTQRPASPPPQDEEYLLKLPQHTTTTTRRPTSTTPPPPPQTTYPSMPSRTPSFSSDCGVVAGGNEHVPLVFHGTGYTRGDWPWLVAMYKRKEGSLTFACSGTLVSDRHVVSAAHCLQQRSTLTSIKDIVIKVGVYNLEDWGDDIIVTRTLESAIIHEEFNSTTYANDLLVLTFDKSVEFNNNIRPACLWNGNNDLNRIVGSSGVVAGWGASELGPGSKGEPRMVRIPIVTNSMCRASRPDFHVFTSDHTFCGGDRNGAGPCLGDSGGGLYILDGGRWRLRGVVSLSLRPENGESTCNLNEYVIFTDAAKFIEWIKNVISNKFR
ncbi:proclotting enzyme-like isoform X2 [Cydia pomonella]|uniref:proclotting enzyme-like isoform X2 n=1 Tax=Cydia pomonella TaxID=82600 RepID=UPI002ADE8C02|nr:proclotting enzyme-like isoform X2 [Cydia pomonella]